MFSFLKKKKTLVTHDGKFHADDIFACAILQMYLDQQGIAYTVIRTRDNASIANADYVFDVGSVYDVDSLRFDHHQVGGAGTYDSDIPYASSGLVWKEYGEKICGDEEVAGRIETRIIMPIDANDNGVSLFELKGDIAPYRVQEYFYAWRPTWMEESNHDQRFAELVKKAKELIAREILVHKHALEAKKFVDAAYSRSDDKKIIELDGEYPWEEWMVTYPEVQYVIYPRSGAWRVGAVSVETFSYELRKPLPQEWAGKRDVALASATGVPDAVFCHNGRFLCVAKSLDGARALARKALAA